MMPSSVRSEKSYAEITELRNCVVCKVEVNTSRHQMVRCSHRFCTQCFNKLKEKHETDQTEQPCPIDGTAIDFKNSFFEQLRIVKDEAERNTRLAAQVLEESTERDQHIQSFMNEFTELEKSCTQTKEQCEKVDELVKEKLESIRDTRESSIAAREGILEIKKDLDQELEQAKKTLKIEKKELNSITKQVYDYEGRLKEYSQNFDENFNEVVRLFMEGVALIAEDGCGAENSSVRPTCVLPHKK